MRRYLALLIMVFTLVSCASVIRKDFMDAGIRDAPFPDLLKYRESYRGRLFVFGGKIVGTKLTEKGSLVEAVYVPVDRMGALKEIEPPTGRFLALYPKERGILDPMIYRRDREITVAATFAGVEEGKIDEMTYTFPFFMIEQVYLWEKNPRVWYGPCPPGYPQCFGPWYRGDWVYWYYP